MFDLRSFIAGIFASLGVLSILIAVIVAAYNIGKDSK